MLRGPLLMIVSVIFSGMFSAIVANLCVESLGMLEGHAMGVMFITGMATFLGLTFLIYWLGYY
ncbi:hypothetical protein [Bremerella alba]|uniref:Uncharacterized protein n=1 Tax=Bremerella alba TaxID=980252 RepID=A0A7V8V737_9BACT|nr:hypothetical protein [Bremerella alba]MBA2116187.1 hypothetical protein [Bremerella alba]